MSSWGKRFDKYVTNSSTAKSSGTGGWGERFDKYVDVDISPAISPRISTVGSLTKKDESLLEKEKKKWYESGLFEDGYDFGDVTKTLLGISDKKKLKTFTAPETTLTLKELKEKHESYQNNKWMNADEQAESLKTTQQLNEKALYEYSQTLSKIKMDGTNRTVLEEIEILANMKSGKEKEARKQKVLQKMELLGMDTAYYSHFAGDGEFDWNTFGKWLSNSAMAGLNTFNKGLLDTADVLLGAPMKELGWENNPISEGAEYYDALYNTYRYNANLNAEKLGGNAWNFGTDAVEGTMGALPNALLMFMTGGQSATATTSTLANQAAAQTGNILTKAGLTTETMLKNPQYWMSFARTLGSDYKEAKEAGASDVAASVGSVLKSLINSGIEIGFDGGSGIQGLQSGLKEGGKPFWEWVESSIEEGGEEVLQKFIGEAIHKAGYGSDEEMLNPIEYAKEGLLGVISGAALGGGQTAVQGGINAYNTKQANKLTTMEQTVVDKLVEKEIAKRESDGKTVSDQDKKQIQKNIENNLRKGYLKAEDIEEVLGGESYNSFKAEMDKFTTSEDYQNLKKATEAEKKAKDEFDVLVKMKQGDMTGEQVYRRDELKKILDESKVNELRGKLGNEANRIMGIRNQMRSQVMDTVKDSRLAESYRELARKQQKFQVDVSKYTNENAKKTVQSILDSGLGDNSNQFHDVVDFLAKISEDKNVTFDLTNNAKLEGTEHYKKGYITHGFINDNGDIVLNKDSDRVIQTTVGHEVTHVLEKAGIYKELSAAVRDFAISKEGLEKYNARLAAAQEAYAGKKNTTAEKEITADLIGEYLFTDSEFVSKLSTSNRNVFQKIYDEIKYLCKVVTAGSKEARELEKVKKLFDQAWRENVNGKADSKDSVSAENEVTVDPENDADLDYESPTKYSVSVKDPKTIDFLENQEHITTYKAMVLIDGKLYPPMATKVKGEDGKYHMTNGRDLGEWVQAEEDTTNIKFNDKGVGYYDLKKDDGGTVRAAYNPYEHSSNLVLNDQFEAAYKRGNLVTVECVIPKSEIDNAYKAQYAKDSTGVMDWHSGVVAGKLTDNKRSVYLSRYLKAVRIVPDSEVARKYKEIVGDLAVPFNVVSPSLLAELENAGVNIDYDGSPQYQYLQRRAAEKAKNTKYSMSLADIKNEFKDKTDYLFIHEKKDGTISLDNMVVKKEFRNQGIGTQILNELISYADENGKIITLTPTSEFGTKAKLTKWYKANGFVENKGRNADYSLSDTMYRLPHPTKALEGGSVTKYSLSTWTPESQEKTLENLIKAGFAEEDAKKWIADTNGIAAVIASDKARLDFEAADNQVMLKDNQEYIKTLDASTLCAKRLVYQGTFDAIQHRLPNTMLSSDDLIDLLNMMKEHGVQTPCGVCYVESRRRHLGKFAQQWLDGYEGEYKPRLDEVTTSDGLEALRKSHPQTYKDFTDAMNKKGSSNPKVVQLRTEYRNEIMSLTPAQIRKIEAIGGLRVQSFSDFETPHLLDMMQAVMDMSAKGLHSQAYTKVPNFAWVFGDTGIKINLSLIADGDGFDADGNLAFSSVEGMDINEAMRLRDAYSQNVGTIIVGANDKHILACMADDRIDYIIPFHRSGWGMTELKMMGMDSYTDYTYGQKEHDLNKPTKVVNGVQQYAGLENLYPPDYWNYELSGKENAERYLALCAKTGREPKFAQFLVNNGDGTYSLQPDGSTDGYWKTLIDFKMYDNDGNGAAQQTVVPNFNMEEAHRVLNEYEGGANKLPVAQDIVEKFVAKYSEDISPVKYSMSKADTDYLDAVNRGDMETAQQMVNEAAEKAGYTSDVSWRMSHTAPNPVDDVSLVDLRQTDLVPDDYWDHPSWYTSSNEELESFHIIKRAIDEQERLVASGDPGDVEIMIYRAVDKTKNTREESVRNGDWVTPSYEYAVREGGLNPKGYRIIKQSVPIKNLYWDGNSIAELGYDDGNSYAYADTKNNRKLLDPVTYDDDGNVIPLSERFKKRKVDIRYSLSKDGDENTYGDFRNKWSDFGYHDELDDFAPIRADVVKNAKNAAPVAGAYNSKATAEDDVPIKTTKEKLDEKLTSRQTELENVQKHRDETIKSLDEKIAKAKAQLDSKKNKDTKAANNLKMRIERLQRLKSDIEAKYAKRISDINKSISKTSEELEKDHTEKDRYARAKAEIEKVLENDKATLTEEYAQRRAELESKTADKDAYFSNKARELYEELRNLRKGVRASVDLGSLLDSGYDWGNLRSVLSNVRYNPSQQVNVNSAEESAVRQLIEESYENDVYSIDDLDVELAEKVQKLEADAETKKETARRATQRRKKAEEHTKLWADLIGDTSTWKDMRTGLHYKTKTLRRILRHVVKDGRGNPDIGLADDIYDELETKYDHNEALLKKESAKLKEAFKNLKLSHAEDQYAQMLGELRYNPETTLTEDVVKEYLKKHKGINEAKVDKAIKESRKLYDDLIVRVNEVLREQGFKEIPYRKGYFPHFTNPKQNWVAKLLNWKTIDTEIPTSIAGLTEMFKPNRSWQKFNKQRMGDKTDYSLYQGLDSYIHGALDWIYHIEDLQKRRSLENYIRYTHSDEGVKQRINEILNSNYDADEAQTMINAVLDEANNPLSGLVRELMNRTNTLANKKSAVDRGMEDMLNRKIYSTMTNLNNRITANMVVGSFSSAMTNFIPMVQSWHQVSPWYTVRGIGDTVRSSIKDDGTIAKSDFLTNRLMEEEKLYKTNWDKASDVAAFMMSAVDNITSQTVWRSKYLQNLREGMSEAQAIRDADQFAKNLMAGRSRGNAPSIFDAKNPLVKIFTAFQLEVANQYGYMFEDVPQDSKNMARMVKCYATAFLGAYAYNALYSTLVGRDAAFDPISIMEGLMKGLLDDDDEEEDLVDDLMDFGKDVLQEVPFVGGLLGGGRIPLSSAFPYSGYSNPIESMMTDLSEGELSKEWLKPLYYLVLPFGGGQMKKTNEGLGMFSEEHPIAGSYTASGNLRFPVEDTIGNRIQAAMFGQYANENARDYFDNERSALKPDQIEEFIDVDIPIRDYWDYRDGLAEYDKWYGKADYIANLDLPVDKKNILINNISTQKDPIDLTGYENFSDYEEFAWAKQYPEKYEFFKEMGVSVQDYKNAPESTKEFYNWAYNYPHYYTLSKAITDDAYEYRVYYKDMSALKADKDKNGKSISGSKKKKVIDYINGLDIEYGAKLVLFKSQYEADDTYNKEIFEYIRDKEGLNFEDKLSILKTLGYGVSDDGTITWD